MADADGTGERIPLGLGVEQGQWARTDAARTAALFDRGESKALRGRCGHAQPLRDARAKPSQVGSNRKAFVTTVFKSERLTWCVLHQVGRDQR